VTRDEDQAGDVTIWPSGRRPTLGFVIVGIWDRPPSGNPGVSLCYKHWLTTTRVRLKPGACVRMTFTATEVTD